jgi:hypothetical protein
MKDLPRALRELFETLDDLDTLLKHSEVGAELADRGVNVSLALVAASGLRAYVEGRKAAAAEDLLTAGEEIRGRLERAKEDLS